jgi:sialate O-acetylesterase
MAFSRAVTILSLFLLHSIDSVSGLVRGASSAAPDFELSPIFTSHMVLARSSVGGGGALVWGLVPSHKVGLKIDAAVDGTHVGSAVSDSSGGFRLRLPAFPAGGPHTLTLSSAGTTVTLDDVLFGDVFLASGQSNACFSTELLTNGTVEVALANEPQFRQIRLLNVEGSNFSASAAAPFPGSAWRPANASSVQYFSAIAWLTGRDVFLGLNATVPIGIVSACVSGSPIQEWVPPSVLSTCASLRPANDPYKGQDSGFYNTYIAPLTVGPFDIAGLQWWQVEANAAYNQTAYYACMFPGLIEAWRAAFTPIPPASEGGSGGGGGGGGAVAVVKAAAPPPFPFHFGFVELQAFSQYASSAHNDTYDVPWVRRDGQQVALLLPNVSLASALDVGDATSPFKSIHPRDKQAVGRRMAAAVLAKVYGQTDAAHESPRFLSATCSGGDGQPLVVTVTLQGSSVGGGNLTLVDPPPVCPTGEGVPAKLCSGFGVQGSDGVWLDAAPALSWGGSGLGVVLTTMQSAPAGVTAARHGYAWSAWPQVALYSGGDGGFPVLGWLEGC